MRPAAFAYVRAEGVAHALALLAEHGEEARPLAGGQSLVPMMNLRLARPEVLVDIDRLPLDRLEIAGGALRIGALVRHARLLADAAVAAPIVAEAVAEIAHPVIRNRGTAGGSVAHADPTAELALLLVLLDGTVLARSAAGGERRIAAADFFRGAFSTALAPGELVTEIEMALPEGPWGGAFVELSERRGDFAIVAVGAAVALAEGRIREARIACAGATATPVRAPAAEAVLLGAPLATADAAAAGRALAGDRPAFSDIRASAAYRRHLLAVLGRRAVARACARAGR